ncbi:MAG: FtsX-like permease family protein [Gemmatimonadales bacterium]|nr:FtsX-like permease family protein [Gemmatimonadales bacterium]NIN13562.1 FtsX-like permease family protein [Gemmatimonadales bacterium]NIR01113.1 FtsX-like permease family protein [Gemmatimonadales bacterium]
MMVVAPLDQAQALTDLPDAATEILVFGVDHRQVELMAAGLSEELDPAMADGLEILSWKEQGELGRLVDTVRPMLGVLFFIFLLMACLIIVNTMLMTVMERTQEFGMQAALGMRRSDIVRLILMEGLTIGVIGALAGGVLGTGVAVWLENVGINLEAAARGIDLPFQGVVYPDWRVSFVLSSAMLGVITAAVATIYPAWRAIRRTPAEALRA